jgi:shikimate dehydrogenase
MPLDSKDFNDLAPDTVVYDIVYNPIKTILIKESERHGLRTIEGLDMLIYQAQRAIEIWTGHLPDVNLMKIAALKALS